MGKCSGYKNDPGITPFTYLAKIFFVNRGGDSWIVGVTIALTVPLLPY
jgi:hypothetical protein